MATVTNKQLHQFLLDCFDDEELEQFCFLYFPEVRRSHFGYGMSMNKKAIELIDYCDRHQIVANLLAALAQEREKLYQQRLATPAARPTPPPLVYSPQPRNPNQIFVSHASKDAQLAHQIAQDLKANGYDIFITPTSIRPGEKWVPAINRGLEESGIFIVLLTPYAVQSHWVHDETNTAIALANANEMRLLMLDVQPCHAPILWRQRQFVAFNSDDYEHNLHSLINSLKGKSVKPQPPPVQLKVPPPKPEPVKQPEPEQNTFIHEKTGLEFVRIPVGEFLYGDDKKPIILPEYWISKTPVTQAVYQRFIAANPKYDVPFREEDWAKPYNWDKNKRTFPADKAEHPVVLVSWYDAVAFCDWAGLQLPTEEQWEKAARGTDGRVYPWGNNEPTAKLCNFNRNVGGTIPVGQYSPQGDSPYGCVDMSGNVWEWCLNKFSTPEVTTIDQSRDRRVVRGGSWGGDQNGARAAARNYYHPDDCRSSGGFRLVRRPPSQ